MRSETISRSLYSKNKEWVSEDVHVHISNRHKWYIFFSGYTALKGGRFGGSPMRKILRIVRHQLSEVRGRASILWIHWVLSIDVLGANMLGTEDARSLIHQVKSWGDIYNLMETLNIEEMTPSVWQMLWTEFCLPQISALGTTKIITLILDLSAPKTMRNEFLLTHLVFDICFSSLS